MSGRRRSRTSTRSSSGPGRTAWPRPSPWPVPGARSASTRPPPTAGGGTRTMELTLPGFRHDMCSTILPLTLASPFFRSIDLAARGVEIVHPDAPVAHPLDGGRAAVLERSVAVTGGGSRRRATGGPGGGCSGRWSRDVGKLGPEILRPVVARPAPSAGAGPVRPAGAAVGRGARPRPVPRRRGAGPVRRDRGPRDAPPRSPVECLVRAGPRDVRPRRRLADDPRRGVGASPTRSSPSSRRPAARS